MNLPPYHVTLEATDFGNYRVSVFHDLAWANIRLNGIDFECQGNNDGFWLDTYDERGCMSTPLQRLLRNIKPGPVELDEWLRGEGGKIVAAWREALARAKAFWENPAQLREAVISEVIDRWQQEKHWMRKGTLQIFIPRDRHDTLGIETPIPIQKGGDLHVPF